MRSFSLTRPRSLKFYAVAICGSTMRIIPVASYHSFSFSSTLASPTGAFHLVCFKEYISGYHYTVPVRFKEYIFRHPLPIVGILFAFTSPYLRRFFPLDHFCTTRSTLSALSSRLSLHSAEELLTHKATLPRTYASSPSPEELHTNQDEELAAEELLTNELRRYMAAIAWRR